MKHVHVVGILLLCIRVIYKTTPDSILIYNMKKVMLWNSYSLCEFVLLAFSLCLVRGTNRPQPWPLIVDQNGICCTLLSKVSGNEPLPPKHLRDEANALDKCLNDVSRRTQESPNPSKVAILTLAAQTSGGHSIPHINLYAPYQRSIVGAYSEHRKYNFRFFSHPNTSEVDEDDYRWNKVPMLIKALDPNTGWAKDAEVIVWIDSDAVILDFSFTVERILKDYPTADFIASADIKLGLINTGMLIIRNSEWSRKLLHRWWTISDRSKVCDQEAFDQLYAQLLYESQRDKGEGIVSKVKVLSTDAINSHPPSWKYQTSSNQILHLMGESATYRAIVFRKAYYEICNARSGGMLLTQLGLDRETMLDFAIDVYKNETQDAFIVANKTGSSFDIEELFKSSHHYVDILYHLMSKRANGNYVLDNLRRQYKNEIVNIREGVLKLILHHIAVGKLNLTTIDDTVGMMQKQLRDILVPSTTDPNEEQHVSFGPTTAQANVAYLENSIIKLQERRNNLMNELVLLLKKAAEAGNSLFWVADLIGDRKKVASLVFDVLDELITNVVDESKSIPLHMKALMHQNLAVTFYEEALKISKNNELRVHNSNDHEMMKMLKEAESDVIQSVEIFEQFFATVNDSSTRMEHLQSLQLHAGIVCTMRKFMDAQGLWTKAIDKARENHGDLKLGIHYERLAIILYNGAICFAESGNYVQSREYVAEARMIIRTIMKEMFLANQRGSNDDVNLKQSSGSINVGWQGDARTTAEESSSNQLNELKNLLSLIDSFDEQLEDMLIDSANHMRHRLEHQDIDRTIGFGKIDVSTNISIEEATPVDAGDFPKMRAIKTQNGIKYVHDDIKSSGSGGDDEYEWEECSEFDTEGCENFVIIEEDSEVPLFKKSQINGIVDETIDSNPSSLYEGLAPDDIEEMMEVRKRYAKLTGIADLGVFHEEDVGSSGKFIDKNSCDCANSDRLFNENEELRRRVRELQTKLDHIAALVKF